MPLTPTRDARLRRLPVAALVLCGHRRRLSRAWLLAVYGLLMVMASSGSVLAAAPLLPALEDPASSEHDQGKVIFLQLVTPDLAAAKTFYAGLFGWAFHDIRFGDALYAEAYVDEQPVAGIIQRPVAPGEHAQPAWLNFISATNVDAMTKMVVAHGGKVLVEPRAAPDLGREAIVADPQGAVFALLASSSGDPPENLPDQGEWIWSTLLTRDPDADAAFYQTLFGYEIFDLSGNDVGGHYLLSSGGYARASVNTLPGRIEQSHPHWLSYVRVVDASKAAAQAVALGGRVLVQPRVDHQGGKIAVVADPTGAPFGLMEWVDDADARVTK